MAKIANPTLFSTYFDISKTALNSAGLLDPFVDVDTPLFIDPVLLQKASDPRISNGALSVFRDHFKKFIRLLAISEHKGDAAWRAAQKLLDLRERPENGLGYGGTGRSGSSRPTKIRDVIVNTSRDIIRLGVKDPELVSLMGFFEENAGPDTISDLTTGVIFDILAEITERFCIENKITLYDYAFSSTQFRLPKIAVRNKSSYVILVPKDLVRELPIANDWSDIERAASENAVIRDRVNAFLATIIEPTVADRKAALRRAALESKKNFEAFLGAVKEHVTTYDPNIDALGYYKLRDILRDGFYDILTENLRSK